VRNRIELSALSRRSFLVTGAAAACLRTSIARADDASAVAPQSQEFKDVFSQLIGNAKPVQGRISVDLPETADNGNFVPITILVDSPMTDADHVTTIHLLSTANPHADVATFHLSPANGTARVQSRMRLAKTQDVIVLAELSNNDMLISTTRVKVMIGGCGI
jgi:sulfur-oxidizing protein SoxY